jgi:hypothetical protein
MCPLTDIPRRLGIKISQFAEDIAAFTPNKNINYAVTTCRAIYLISNHVYTNGK